jgi:hypothetical protein
MNQDESDFIDAFMKEYEQLFEDLGNEVRDF